MSRSDLLVSCGQYEVGPDSPPPLAYDSYMCRCVCMGQ